MMLPSANDNGAGPSRPASRLGKGQRTDDLLGAYDAYLAFSYRLAPFNPDSLLTAKGYAAVEDQLTLSCIRAPFDIIRDSALARGWSWEPAYNDAARDGQKAETAQQIADALTYDCTHIVDAADNAIDFRQVLRELLLAVHTGFHVTEIQWKLQETGPNAGKWGFQNFASKPARQIGFDLDRRTLAIRAITSYTPLTGYRFDIPPEKCLVYTYSPRDSLPYGNGLGRVVYKHGWSFDFTLKFLNIAIETFAVPFLLGFAPKASLAVVRSAIAQMRQGAPAVLPNDAKAELMEVSGGAISGMLDAIEMHRQACASVYLHSTLTSGVGQEGGNRALGQVHQDTQQYSLDTIRADLEMVLTRQLARRWVRYNFGPEMEEYCPRLRLGQWDAVDSLHLAQAFATLVQMGTLHPDEPIIRQRLALPPPAAEHRRQGDLEARPASQKGALRPGNQAGKTPFRRERGGSGGGGEEGSAAIGRTERAREQAEAAWDRRKEGRALAPPASPAGRKRVDLTAEPMPKEPKDQKEPKRGKEGREKA